MPSTAKTSARARSRSRIGTPGDTVALADRVYRVRDVVYFEVGDVRGLLQLEAPYDPNMGE